MREGRIDSSMHITKTVEGFLFEIFGVRFPFEDMQFSVLI